ncbi:MerR family transcriptional regulator [Planococcus kocurii]|uniref:MerR family transcriptional regulator n=1 Tax=Planococcus kocurii TaxID=1374 RepID=UPI003CFF644C
MTFHAPEDIATVLKIKPSTLRKYSLLLEQSGYLFKKNAQGHRWYSDTDLAALRKFITLKDSSGMNLEDSADAVFLWSKGDSVAGRATSFEATQGDTERHEASVNELTLEERLLRLIQHQQQSIDRMAQSVQKQEQQSEQILEEVKTLKGNMQPLDAPSSDQSKIESVESSSQQPEREPEKVTSKKDTRSLWARIWNK